MDLTFTWFYFLLLFSTNINITLHVDKYEEKHGLYVCIYITIQKWTVVFITLLVLIDDLTGTSTITKMKRQMRS